MEINYSSFDSSTDDGYSGEQPPASADVAVAIERPDKVAITDLHKAILDNTTDSIVLIAADHKVLSYNREIQHELYKYFGKNITTGDDYRDFVIDTHKELYLTAFDKAMRGEVIAVETETIAGDVAIWFLYKVNPVYDAQGQILGVALTATNIDARKRKEIALEASERTVREQAAKIASSEKYYRTLIETSSDAIVLLDETGKVLYQTPSTQKILGYSLEEMQQIEGIDLIHADDRARDHQEFADLARIHGQVLKRRHRIKHKNGDYKWISATYRNLLGDKDVNAIVMNYADISDKVNFEEGLKKANRELAVLNAVNDVIIRAHDELLLYDAICNCIVEMGGYQLAWICHKPRTNDDDKKVLPLSAAGQVAYLQDIVIDMADPELSKGPTGTVLNTGKTVITNNISSSESYHPWLEKARHHGISASIVLPFNFKDGTTGAINIYSERTNAFDEHETMILERVAINISVAVDNVRVECEKERTKHLLRERIKELTTIYNVNRILQDGHQAADEIFDRIVNTLPAGWQYPDICVARISFEGQNYLSAGYGQVVAWHEADFTLVDGRHGTIEVAYMLDMPTEYEGPFLKEERDLLDTVAETIEVYFNKAAQQRSIVQSESYLRSSFQYAAIGKAFTDLDGRFFKVNNALCEMVGYSEEELLNITFPEITLASDQEHDKYIVDLLMKGDQQYYRTEKRYIHKNGSIVWINLNTSLIRDEAGRPLYFISQIENITDRKRAEALLVQSEANLRTIFDNTEVGYLLLDNKYNVVAFNQSFYNGFAAERNLLLEQRVNYLELLPPDRKDIAAAHFERVITERKPLSYEMQFLLGDAGNYYSINVVPVIDGQEVIGICVSAINITNSKRQELERQGMINDLLQKNSDLQQFAYIVSHNIRGPLSTILGLNNIVDVQQLPADHQFYFDGIRQSSDKLDMVIRDLNLILQVKRGATALKTNVRLKDVIEEVLRELQPEIAQDVTINCDTGEITEITTVEKYIRDIVYNLVSNAIKFRRRGVPAAISITARKEDNELVLVCADNGTGIDMEKYGSKMFTLYQRLNLTVAGKGFGLFITKTEVEALNGRIEVESMPGSGATFRVYLPQ